MIIRYINQVTLTNPPPPTPIMSRVFTTELKDKDCLYSMVPKHIPTLEDIFESTRDADKGRVILQYLFTVRQRMQENPKKYPRIKRETRWCPAASENLKGLVHDYKRIIQVLKDNGIIEYLENEQGKASYQEDEVPIQYRVIFPKHILKAGAKKYRWERIETNSVIKSVGNYYSKRYDRHRKKVLKRTPWLAPSIDFIDELYLELPDNPFAEIEGYTEKTDKQAMDFINGRAKFLAQDYYGGRFYSQITSLPKILRPYLRHSYGDRLAILDIKACQPYLLSALFHKPRLLELIPEFLDLYPRIAKHANTASTRLFYKHCSTGEFYQTLMDASGMKKEELKDKLFGHVFFASLYKYLNKPEIGLERWWSQRLFWSIYTDPFKTLLALKHTKRADIPKVDAFTLNEGREYHLYNTPNLMAARLEVEIVLNKITQTCLKHGLKLTTIHDAWLISESDKLNVLDIYNSAFSELGVNPPAYSMKYPKF